jgi:hypothetical protein
MRFALKLSALVFLPTLILFSQQPQQERRPWLTPWREATVALGVPEVELSEILANGTIEKKKAFGVKGTGVLMGLPDDIGKNPPWLVTAKHVFYKASVNPAETWDPSSLNVRFSWFDQRTLEEYRGIPIKLKDEKGQRLWYGHPSADLACIPLLVSTVDAGRDSLNGVSLELFAKPDDLLEGAPVVVLGYPGAVGSEFSSKALLRQGVVSWVSPTQPESNRLLIDSNLFPGNSGGPVFKLPTGTDRYGNFNIGGRVAFLGIVSEGRFEGTAVVIGGKPIEAQTPNGKQKAASLQWIGIGVIEPASRVKELLELAHKKVYGN